MTWVGSTGGICKSNQHAPEDVRGKQVKSQRMLWLVLVLASIGLVGCGIDDRAAQVSRVARIEAPQPQTGFVAAVPKREGAASAAQATTPAYSLDEYGYFPVPVLDSGVPPGNNRFATVHIGEMTGDGRNDIAAVGYGVSSTHFESLLIYRQNGDGTFTLAYIYPVSNEGYAESVMGDFNHDGRQDIVVAEWNNFVVFSSQKSGGFAPRSQPIYDSIGLDSEVRPVAADFNRDGNLDLAFYLKRAYGTQASVATFPRLVVWYGDGHGGFPERFSTVTYGTDEHDSETPLSLATGDLNGDGWTDLAVRLTQADFGAQRQWQRVRTFVNDRTGVLVSAANIDATMDLASYSFVDHLAIADFNGDGRSDIAGSSLGMDMHVWMLPQSTAGKFDQAPVSRVAEPIGSIAIAADLDNNGEQDLLVAHSEWFRVTYYLQHDGKLDEKQVRGFDGRGPVQESGMAVGDLNGDGCRDVAIAGSYDGLFLMRGSGCTSHKASATPDRTKKPVAAPKSARASKKQGGQISHALYDVGGEYRRNM